MIPKNHNNPPEILELAREVTRNISEWFAENIGVSNADQAKQAKLQIDRAKLCLKDLEDERDGKVRPLNEKVLAINADYRAVKRPLDTLLGAMLSDLNNFVKAEEQRRIDAAIEAQRIADEAEQKAREAERIERELLSNAAQGEVGIDIAATTLEADRAFAEFEKAKRSAIRAEEGQTVIIRGGLGKGIGLREKEVLTVDDPLAAITEMGLTDNVQQAIITAARAYRRLNKRLPSGISATIERRVQ